MKKQYLFALWGGLFALCAALGFIPTPGNGLKILMMLLAVAFFVPAGLLLRQSAQTGDRHTAALIRNLAIASLALTVIFLVANFLSALGSATLGNFLYSVLIVVSTPMICGRYWVLSLFLWACLMIGAVKILRQAKKS